MNPTEIPDGSKKSVHWTVKSNYRLRIGSFAIMFASVAFHGYENGLHPVLWVLAVLQLLVYPHVVYWLARRSANSQQAEVNNLTVDCLLFGILMAALEFPLWITFTVYLASTLNITISRGVWGLLRSQLAFFGGALCAVVVLGWHVSPATGGPATALCIFGNLVYMVAIGITAYSRNQQLRETREALRLGEQALKLRLGEIESLQAQLQEQATRDPLTGLFNRRFLDTIVGRELARCEREALHMTVMMIDVDHFKKVNDTYGHPGGDEVLKRLAALLLGKVRVIDVACRYGGEEFLLLLPSMPSEIAMVRAEQWREAFAKEVVSLGALRMQATISIGVATYPEHGDTLSALTRSADLALYRAKKEGRNRVVLYQAGMQS
jgi:diguanylate cyclase